MTYDMTPDTEHSSRPLHVQQLLRAIHCLACCYAPNHPQLEAVSSILWYCSSTAPSINFTKAFMAGLVGMIEN